MAAAWLRLIGPALMMQASLYGSSLRAAGLELDATQAPGVVGHAAYGVVLFEETGEEVTRVLRETSSRSRVLAAGVHPLPRSRDVWSLLAAGAQDVVAVQDDPAALAALVKARIDRWATVDGLLDSDWVTTRMIGRSPAWRSKLRELAEAARFTRSPILILGESGTGKEAAARMVHELDARPDKQRFVVLDCTTIVPELSGSEFFGHERGAFTGAVSQREGAFALANGGTLFLDEVGELPLPMQAQLLRVIQEHSFKRVGGNTWMRAEFRLVCATNRNLEQMVREGRFRADLYYRIASVVTTLPPLCQREDDILPLVQHFLAEGDAEPLEGCPPPVLDDALRDYLLRRPYPGNVRELKHLVARLLHRYVGGGLLTVGSIPPEDRPGESFFEAGWQTPPFEQAVRRAVLLGTRLRDISRASEDLAVRIAVEAADGNLQRAAATLGVTDRALQMRRANGRLWTAVSDGDRL
jgi:transcriptional regulator with GAF, ATPase, and Fis domain